MIRGREVLTHWLRMKVVGYLSPVQVNRTTHSRKPMSTISRPHEASVAPDPQSARLIGNRPLGLTVGFWGEE